MSSLQPEAMSVLFCVTETTENEDLMVTAHPEIWVKDLILYWPPPGEADRSKPVPPQPHWTPIACRVLEHSIVKFLLVNVATFKEALYLEKRYSKHRDSSSFREAEARKALKRLHPVTENETMKENLINMNSLISKINQKQAEPDQKNVKKMKNDPKSNRFHYQCLQKNETTLKSKDTTKSKPVAAVQQSQFKPLSKPKTLKLKSDNTSNAASIQAKKPRYDNYLKSGRNNDASPQKKIPPLPPLKHLQQITKTKCATITKEEFLKQKGLTEYGFQNTSNIIGASTPITETNNTVPERFTNNATNVDGSKAVMHNTADQTRHIVQSLPNTKHVSVTENILIKPATIIVPPVEMNHELDDNSNTTNLFGLIKDLFKQSDEKRIRFEARMQTQWDLFAKKVMLTQARNDGDDYTLDETEDFADLDKHFPVTVFFDVEQLDWDVERDLAYKRRLRNRIDQLGGKSAEEAIRLKMKYFFADTVLARFSWKGTITKKSFENLLYLNDLIFKSVRTQFRTYTLKEYGGYMSQWIKHAKSRQRTVVYTYPNVGGNRRNGDMDNSEFKPTERGRNQAQAQRSGEAEFSDFQQSENGQHASSNRRFQQRNNDMDNFEFKLTENRQKPYQNRYQEQAQRSGGAEFSDFQQNENGQQTSRNRRFQQRSDDMDNSEFKHTEIRRRNAYHNRYHQQAQRSGEAEMSDFQHNPSHNRRFEQRNREVDISENERTGFRQLNQNQKPTEHFNSFYRQTLPTQRDDELNSIDTYEYEDREFEGDN